MPKTLSLNTLGPRAFNRIQLNCQAALTALLKMNMDGWQVSFSLDARCISQSGSPTDFGRVGWGT